MADARRVLLIGDGDLAGEVDEALDSAGAQVKWLEEADDETVREALAVHRLGAAYIAGVALGSDAEGVAMADGRAQLLLPGGKREPFPLEIAT